MSQKYSNSNIYEFLAEEIKHYPDIMQLSSSDLMAYKEDRNFWEELSEKIDCFRICDHCRQPMIEGYCIDDGFEHYCSDECLHTHYSTEEYERMYADSNGISYYTN